MYTRCRAECGEDGVPGVRYREEYREDTVRVLCLSPRYTGPPPASRPRDASSPLSLPEASSTSSVLAGQDPRSCPAVSSSVASTVGLQEEKRLVYGAGL